jgi:hypothetical protein
MARLELLGIDTRQDRAVMRELCAAVQSKEMRRVIRALGPVGWTGPSWHAGEFDFGYVQHATARRSKRISMIT